MADVKASEVRVSNPAAALDGTEIFTATQAGTTVGGIISQILTYVGITLAPKASPTFTGTPAAPTAAGGTSTTQVATTAFVAGEVSTHSADTTSVHGITDTSALYAAGGTDVAVADGGTGASTAAAARGNLAAAPADATYIMQTANSETSAEQALSTLATGYVKNTTGTGVLSVQAAPIPAADGGALARGRYKQGGTTYFAIPGADISSVGTRGMTNGRIYYAPWIVQTAITIDLLSIEVTTNVASAEARAGVYNADTDWQPTSLLVDTGIIDCSTTGVKSVSVSLTLPPGRYLAAVIANSTQTLRQYRSGSPNIQDVMGASPSFENIYVASTYGALNSTGVAWTSIIGGTQGAGHQVVARISVP